MQGRPQLESREERERLQAGAAGRADMTVRSAVAGSREETTSVGRGAKLCAHLRFWLALAFFCALVRTGADLVAAACLAILRVTGFIGSR